MLIDWDQVRNLREEIGPEAFDQVVDLFLAEVGAALDSFDADADAPALRASLHALKGSCLNLGFAEMAKLCKRWEMAASLGETAHVDLPRLRVLYDDSCAEFLAQKQAQLG